MFVDFDRVFSKTPQTELKIPQALIDQLSTDLPDGFKYVLDDNTNNITITHEGKQELKYTINGLFLEPTEKQKVILGDEYSFDDIIALSYNSQQPVPVRFKKERYVNINGKDIPIEKLSYNPFKPYKIKIDSTYIYPQPFPPTFNITMGSENVSVILSINRIPNNSIETMAFESDRSKCLNLKYSINANNNMLSMTININLANATTVQEIIESIEVYNAFVEGKGYLNGSLIETRLETSNISKYDEKALLFWNKVREIEEKINVLFDPNNEVLDFEQFCRIEELYQYLINRNPIRHNNGFASITSKWDFNKDDIASENLGKPIYFEFDGRSSFDIFGQEIELPCIIGVYNAIFANYEKTSENEECTIFLENESEEKQMYTSTMCFISNEDMLEYKKTNKERILLFRDAKKIQDYLND